MAFQHVLAAMNLHVSSQKKKSLTFSCAYIGYNQPLVARPTKMAASVGFIPQGGWNPPPPPFRHPEPPDHEPLRIGRSSWHLRKSLSPLPRLPVFHQDYGIFLSGDAYKPMKNATVTGRGVGKTPNYTLQNHDSLR